MQKESTKEVVKQNLTRIFGTDFKVKDWEGGIKVNVPSIDVVQMHELTASYLEDRVRDINLKRSGTGITVIVTI